MKQDDDRFPEALARAAQQYNTPPELSSGALDDMWAGIEEQAFPRRFASPGSQARFAYGGRARAIARYALPMAAALLLGVAIGRFSMQRQSPPVGTLVAMRPASDSMALPEPYQSTTSRYLGQTAALLVALPGEGHAGRADEALLGRAHDLLLTTRLLLDSPAAADPRIRTLFEDLELVLAQIVRLQNQQSRAELDLIRQALEQRDVLPRLRNAVADMAADD